jgi:hypothetical protein
MFLPHDSAEEVTRSGRTNRQLYFHYLINECSIQCGPHRRHHVQQFFYCGMCVCCRGNVFTVPLPSKVTWDTQTRRQPDDPINLILFFNLLLLFWKRRRFMEPSCSLSLSLRLSFYVSPPPPYFLLGGLWFLLAVCVCVYDCVSSVHPSLFYLCGLCRIKESRWLVIPRRSCSK